MYSVSTRKKFISQHFLPNESGRENSEHSHQYRLQVLLFGEELNQNGYLINLDKINDILEEILEKFRDKTLNDMNDFNEKTPTLENFAKILWEHVNSQLNDHNLAAIEIRLWEDTDSYASYKEQTN